MTAAVRKVLLECLELTCQRCAHVWHVPPTRKTLPKWCAHCKAKNWQLPAAWERPDRRAKLSS